MGQADDDRAEIVKLIHDSRIAVWTQDFEAWKACFVHAPYTTRWGYWRRGGTFVRQGWEDLSERARKHMAENMTYNAAFAFETKVENLQLRISGDMAWATYDQQYPGYDEPGHIGPGLLREIRIFERHDGRWRIALLGFLDNNAGRDGAKLLTLGPEGDVRWTSPAAAEALKDDDDLVIRNGRLRFRNSRLEKKLQAALRWAGTMDDGYMGRNGAVPIVLDPGEGLPVRIFWVIADAGMILFSLDDPSLAEDRLDTAAMVFELSPLQKRVAGLVAEGLALPEVAKRLGVSPSTARTHLQRVFDKTGVHNQPALVRVLLTVAAPL